MEIITEVIIEVCIEVYIGVIIEVIIEVYIRSDFSLTGPLFPIGIQHLVYMICFCYDWSNGY